MIKLKDLIRESFTETPQFKSWFGDSKVIDNQGKPLIVYHASKTNPKNFDSRYKTDLSSMGFHFGTAEQASFRTTQYDFQSKNPSTGKYCLSIKNPLEVSHMASFAPDHLAEKMIDLGMLSEDQFGKIRDKFQFDEVKVGESLVKILKKRGVDGLKYENEREGKGYSWVPFDATQIKSSMGNNGDFNPNNSDVTKESYDAKIKSLEDEWDRLDSTGNQVNKQQEISKKLSKLRHLKQKKDGVEWYDGKWDKTYSAIQEGMDNPAIYQQAHKFDSNFIEYVKSVENGAKSGFNKEKNLWFPHKSPEGGLPTIAYGHKLTSLQDVNKFQKGITDSSANSLLMSDLEKAKEIVYKDIKEMFNVSIPLNKKQEEMLIDFAFNLGTLKKFPKFVKAVLNNDTKEMKKEYKRSSNHTELTGRNQAFEKRFLK